MALRLVIAVFSGTAVTLGILFLMQSLIATGEAAVVDDRPRTVLDFVQKHEEPPAVLEEITPVRPPPVEPPPPTIIEGLRDFDSGGQTISFPIPKYEKGIDTGPPRFGLSDGGVLPLRKVEPAYPARARANNLEGYVIVEFTVTRLGNVTDIVVLESSHSVFERAARVAASKFLYKPQIVDGEAIDTPGVQNKITFQLE